MLGSADAADVVADFLASSRAPNAVLDPVLRSTSGTPLLDAAGCSVLVKRLIPLSAVITPNLSEASVLTGLPVRNEEEMRQAAARLHEMGAPAVVITGGHLDRSADLLSRNHSGLDQQFFRAERIVSKSTRRHRVCLFVLHSLPSGAWPESSRGGIAGEVICKRCHRSSLPGGARGGAD